MHASNLNYYCCIQVREAIHVASLEKIGGWQACSRKVKYTFSTPSLLPIYPTLISNYRTLIFNGDVDGCVPYISDEVREKSCQSCLFNDDCESVIY